MAAVDANFRSSASASGARPASNIGNGDVGTGNALCKKRCQQSRCRPRLPARGRRAECPRPLALTPFPSGRERCALRWNAVWNNCQHPGCLKVVLVRMQAEYGFADKCVGSGGHDAGRRIAVFDGIGKRPACNGARMWAHSLSGTSPLATRRSVPRLIALKSVATRASPRPGDVQRWLRSSATPA